MNLNQKILKLKITISENKNHNKMKLINNWNQKKRIQRFLR